MDQAKGSDFSLAAQGALRYLRSKIGFDLWMIARAEGEHWIVLETDGDRYGLARLTSFRCADAATSPNCAAASLSSQAPIGTQIGLPLTYQDGALFGTLCAIDAAPRAKPLEEDLRLVEMVARMLSGVLAAELRTVDAQRERERSPVAGETDHLTGLINRAGWDRTLPIEEERCQRYGSPAFVGRVDLEGLKALNEVRGYEAGDKLIRRAAKVLRKHVREGDIVARLGGDEFGILGTPGNPSAAEEIARKIRKGLEGAGVRASVGMSARVPALQLGELWLEADQRMSDEKAARRLQNTAGELRRFSRSQTFPLENPLPNGQRGH